MKLTHLSILFVAIYITIIVIADTRVNNVAAMAEARSMMDFYLDQAMESSVNKLKQMETDSIDVSDLDLVADSFFSSMHASLGILSDPVAQEKFRAYIPMIAVITMYGYFLMYNDEYMGDDGYTYISRRWTELKPYYYQDENFIYRFTLSSDITLYDRNKLFGPVSSTKLYQSTVEELRDGASYGDFRSRFRGNFLLDQELFPLVRQQAVVDCLGSDLTWYISRHNEIATNYGITYQFGLPVEDSSWSQTIDSPGVVVVFQGMPLVEGSNRVYNRVAFSGAGIRKDGVYYIEQYGWYDLYHKAGCLRLEGNLNIRDEHYYSVEECSKLGSYACPDCDPVGVHAPDYDARTMIQDNVMTICNSIKKKNLSKYG